MSESKKQDLSEVQNIQEFVVSSEKTRSERKRAERASLSAITTWSNQKKALGMLGLFIVLALIYILVGYACKLNLVVICLILMIQTAIGVLLDQNPIWLHSCVVVADVIVGICVNQTLFMFFAALVYVGAIVTLEVMQRLGVVDAIK